MNLPKSTTFLSNFSKGDKIIHFSNEIIFGQLLQTFGDFYMVALNAMASLINALQSYIITLEL